MIQSCLPATPPPPRMELAATEIDIDFRRLANLREQKPRSTDTGLVRPRPGWRAASRDGDLTVWEESAPWPGVYVPPLDSHLVIVSLAQAPGRVTWMAGEGIRVRQVRPGDVLILPAGEPMYLQLATPHRTLVMSLRPRMLYRCHADGSRPREAMQPLRSLGGAQDPVIHGLAVTMCEAAQADAASCGAFLDAMAMALATRLLSHHVSRSEAVGGRLGQHKIAAVCEYLETHIAQPISLADMARVAGYSVYHFSHLFKASSGLTPMRYLLKQRMERARELIETTRLSMTDIGAQVGLGNPAQFSRAFRSYWNESPSSLRRQR